MISVYSNSFKHNQLSSLPHDGVTSLGLPPCESLSVVNHVLCTEYDQKSDWRADGLAFMLVIGLVISYVPQVSVFTPPVHPQPSNMASQLLRIIRAGTSVGFSPWFLLLGSTSSAAAMLNMYVAHALCCCGLL